MREKYLSQLKELHDQLVNMGTLCEDAITLAIESFLNGKVEFQNKADVFEQEINEMEKKIEQLCMTILLHQQPVASDLREVSSALKMITDLERIGDQAYDIAYLTGYSDTTATKSGEHLRKMASESVSMVKKSIESFINRDAMLAKEVIAYDDVVDGLFNKVKNDCMIEMKDENCNAEAIIDILMTAKYLERIADHATNIGEWVVFAVTGEKKEI